MTVMWPAVEETINKKFKVLTHIDLPLADYQPAYLDNALKSFEHHKFKDNEIILVTHYDTQYYMPHYNISITLFNLHLTLSTYNIPSEFVIMFSNHYGIEKELKELSKIFNFENQIQSFVSFYDIIGTTNTVPNIDVNHNQIEHLFCCINGQQRTSRLLFLALLKHHNLISSGIVTTNFQKKEIASSTSIPVTSSIEYVTLNIPTRINDRLQLDLTTRNIFEQYLYEFKDKKLTNELVYGQPNDAETRWQPNFIQKSLIYIVTETVGDYPYPFLTEKTFKGILSKRPMLIAGPRYSVATLRDLGFKTWNNFWNEDYDNDQYFYQRANKIVNILKNYSTIPINELKSICYEMENVLEYNFQHYKNNFCKKDLELFLKKIETTKV